MKRYVLYVGFEGKRNANIVIMEQDRCEMLDCEERGGMRDKLDVGFLQRKRKVVFGHLLGRVRAGLCTEKRDTNVSERCEARELAFGLVGWLVLINVLNYKDAI